MFSFHLTLLSVVCISIISVSSFPLFLLVCTIIIHFPSLINKVTFLLNLYSNYIFPLTHYQDSSHFFKQDVLLHLQWSEVFKILFLAFPILLPEKGLKIPFIFAFLPPQLLDFTEYLVTDYYWFSFVGHQYLESGTSLVLTECHRLKVLFHQITEVIIPWFTFH